MLLMLSHPHQHTFQAKRAVLNHLSALLHEAPFGYAEATRHTRHSHQLHASGAQSALTPSSEMLLMLSDPNEFLEYTHVRTWREGSDQWCAVHSGVGCHEGGQVAPSGKIARRAPALQSLLK
eukprot:TRINITY_DN443_c0_g2_i1.p1 TRINITY_DN443_c0_g2~~TRINITY_DN443_c0_g2_i1.p1  ORF type:complete len:122 (+),score=12.23 TRINITY_DN443_c0_g2_i1:480-845(+)